MADKKISALTSASTPLAGTEVLPIVQSGSTVKVANNDLRPKQIQSNATSGVLQVAGPATAATRVMTTPDANFTVARTDAGQTFTGNQRFNNNIGMNIDAYGWGTDYRAIDGYGAVALSGSFGTVVARNCYNDNTNWKAKYTADERPALYVQPYAGGHEWYNGNAFVTAGNNVTMTKIGAFDTSGNYTYNIGNVVFGTAAKGVNFTANTPAAGMTSQLLNWYEEGTWTPAQGSGLTVVGAFSSSGTYTRIGRQVTVSGTVTGATSVAVAAAGIVTTNLPFTVVTAGHGNATNAAVNASAAVICTTTNVTSANAIAATGTITFSATYFV